jgi:cell division septation protein DedD
MANKSTSKKSPSRKKKTGNIKFKLELGLAGLIYLGIFIVLGMVWAFILGVYIGRGHQPEEVVPEISRIMPETRVRSNRTGSSPGTIKQDILKPEQLEFYDKLKNPPGTELHHDTPKQTKVKQIRTKATKHTSPSRKKKKKTKVATITARKNIYSYTYQVAAFKSFDRASNMQKSLVAQGIMSSISRTSTNQRSWLKVFVYFQGAPEQAEKFKKKLKKLGIKRPILKKKKAIRRRTN